MLAVLVVPGPRAHHNDFPVELQTSVVE